MGCDESTVSESLESQGGDPEWHRIPTVAVTVQSQRDSEGPAGVALTTAGYRGISVYSSTAVGTEAYAKRLPDSQRTSGT